MIVDDNGIVLLKDFVVTTDDDGKVDAVEAVWRAARIESDSSKAGYSGSISDSDVAGKSGSFSVLVGMVC